MTSPEELRCLVERSRAGDLEAFDRIVEEFHPRAFRIACRMLGSREAAEDAAQEVFVKVWRGLGRFRGSARFTTWFHSIVVNQCHDAGRRLGREHSLVASDPARLDSQRGSVAGEPPFGPDWALRVAIRQAIGNLPDKLRTVVTLRYYGDYSVEEIAAALDLPRGTVYSRLSLALERLERVLDLREERSS